MREGAELPPLREVIARYGLGARKSLGQHFLLDLNLTKKIARAAGPLEESTIIEVGPGPGALTRSLLTEGAQRVIAIERDERCLPALAEIASHYAPRLEVVHADALDVDEAELVSAQGVHDPVRIASNLPYNVGTLLLIKWLRPWPPFWTSMTLMFQREVAERIVAAPGTEGYGRLSVLTQWRAHARILFSVSRAAFVPPPQVDSCVVRIEPRNEPVAPARLEALEAVTRAAFGQRRKTLRNSLKAILAEEAIRAAGVDPVRRAETLSIVELAALARALDAHEMD